MRFVFQCIGFFSILLYVGIAQAYDIETHKAITEKAYKESILSSLNFQQTFGIPANKLFNPLHPANGAIATDMKPIDSSYLIPSNAKDMILYGSMAEDDGVRPLNHFMDTQNGNEKLMGISPGNTAEWALGGIFGGTRFTQQLFSLEDAYDNYALALREKDGSDQQVEHYGKMFQAIGQVLHLLHDMAQPEHVRADMHCNTGYCEFLDAFGIYDPSGFEENAIKYVKENIDSIYAASSYSAGIDFYSEGFNTSKDYWLKPQSGLANYTSENYVSKDTNYKTNSSYPGIPGSTLYDDMPNAGSYLQLFPDKDHPLPDGSQSQLILKNYNAPDLCGAGNTNNCEFSGEQYFIARNIYDPLTHKFDWVEHYAAFGLLDEALMKISKPPLVTLNRFTDEAHLKVLIPRAIGFSTALINHFFRGSINIKSTTSSKVIFSLGALGQTNNSNFVGTATLWTPSMTDLNVGVKQVNWKPSQGNISFNFTYPTDTRFDGVVKLVFTGKIDGEPVVMGKKIMIPSPSEPTPTPLTCGVPLQQSGQQGSYLYPFNLPSPQVAQKLSVAFEAYSIPDRLKISGSNGTIKDTGIRSGYDTFTIDYDPAVHGSSLSVLVDAPQQGTEWKLCVNCASSSQTCSLTTTDRKKVLINLYEGDSFWSCPITGTVDGVEYNDFSILTLTTGPHVWIGKLDQGAICTCSSGAACNVPGSPPSITIGGTKYDGIPIDKRIEFTVK